MGQINVEGLGVVDIKGDIPTFSEMQEIQKNAEAIRADNIVTGEAENEVENFFQTPAFGRLVLEAGLSIGGAIATGGLGLPVIAARAGFLARPFLTQLAKSAAGSAAGGASGAAISQTFDPRENVGKEMIRGATEGALAEIVGAPLGIKAAQVISKGFSMPMKHPKLLEGALMAEKALVGKARTIRLADAAFRGDEKQYQKLLDEFTKADDASNIPVNERTKFQSFNEAKLKATQPSALLLSESVEASKGLTPGIKTSNRPLEIIENISQKSLIGGGALSKRYLAMREVGDSLADDFVKSMSIQSEPVEVAELLFKAIGKSGQASDDSIRGLFNSFNDANFKNALKLAGDNANKPVFLWEPIGKALVKDIENFSIAKQAPFREMLNKLRENVGGTVGNATSLNRLIAFRSEVTEAAARAAAREEQKLAANFRAARDEIDKIIEGNQAVRVLGGEAGQAYQNAIKFKREGENLFNQGIIKSILNRGDPKTASAVDGAYDAIVKTRSGSLAGAFLKNIDEFTKLKNFEGQPVLSVKKATELKESLKGAYITDMLGPASKLRVADSQFGGPKISKKKFDDLLVKDEGLIKTIMGDKDFKRLEDLRTQIAFSQGDLSNIGGIPGGVLIQMKQAGAAGNVLQMITPGVATAGQVGLAGAGFAFGLPFASLFILTAPWMTAKALTNPKTNRVLFPRAKDLPKGFTKNPKNEADRANNYSLLFRGMVNAMYKEGYIDDAEKTRAETRLRNFNNQELVDIDATLNRTQADRISDARQLPTNLPNINVSTPQSFGGTTAQSSRVALAGNDPLLQGIASRSLSEGGILDAKKNN